MTAPTGMDWDWAIDTGGNLSGSQRRQQLGLFLAAAPQLIAGRVKLAMGRRGNGRCDLGDVPDSKLAKAAEIEARECLTPHVLEHSYRTYFFGRALYEFVGAPYDDELAYVASLLHDLKLEHPTPGRCFAVTGAERAVDFVKAHGATPEQAATIGAGIAAHLTVGVAQQLGDLGFVSAGAGTDVFGTGLAEMSPDWVAALLRQHPRHDFKRHMRAAVAAESAAVPGGRTKWLSTVGFQQLIQLAPFAE
ncbi:phosphohydrolase [Nocardia arthritidis]|uniref:Phosphohydrolase n=2 Tax=Nocardia arthritidis TaxID=228602 RepID=A0A6G9YTH8_9NOCA|nr:phosphohydrolase [Nocardia arthritidis]